MSEARVLVAGIGNVFLGDDAFGVEVARRLARRPLPAGVRVMDAGIRAFDLAYAMLEERDATILVDLVRRGGAPGTLYTLDVDLPEATAAGAALDGHAMDVVKALALARALGARPARLSLIGCEPDGEGPDDDSAPGLSPAVAAAVEPAVALIESLVARVCLAGTGRA